jgi:hypothetical protein
MLYRKAAPQPARMLLRIVATASAGALLGVAACGSDSSIPGPDLALNPQHGADATADDSDGCLCGYGSTALPPDASNDGESDGSDGAAAFAGDAGSDGADGGALIDGDSSAS